MKYGARNPKITPRHLSLLGVVYIRRSSIRQVIEHQGSGIYQRSFRELARSFGWDDRLIVEIDLDDGRTGTETSKRQGFQWIREQVYEGHVGAIFCWEASRLCRDNGDFAQLIKLCAAYDTLIIDEKDVYDPNNLNDRIYLGIMGVLSEAEVRRFADRSVATRRAKAEVGRLRLRPPTGYVYDDSEDKLVFDTDEEVRNTIHLFFSKYDEYGSAYKVAQYFNRKGIKFPALMRRRGKKSQMTWVALMHERALFILHCPIYAGAYVYGRWKIVKAMVGPDTTEQKKRQVKVSLDSEEVVIIQGAHEGYISWEKFVENQQRLKNSMYVRNGGTIRNGAALLQGIVICSCGKRMGPHYATKPVRKGPAYICNYEQKTFGQKVCFYVTAHHIDRTVSNALLEALSPARLYITYNALEVADEQAEVEDKLQLAALQRAREDLDAARRRFDSIDPANWLVAKEYEKRMQDKYIEVQKLEQERAKAPKTSRRQLLDDVRQSLLALGPDVRSVWESNVMSNEERKRVLRCLIKEVRLKKKEDPNYLEVIIYWAFGEPTPLVIYKDPRRPLTPETVGFIRSLARDHTAPQIAERLRKEGIKTKDYENFSPKAVRAVCRSHRIRLEYREKRIKGDKPLEDERYTISAMAKMLGISKSRVYRLCRRGLLDVTRKHPRGFFRIKISTEEIQRLKED